MIKKKKSKKVSITKSVRVYADTMTDVKKAINGDPRMTLARFYDEAAKEKLANLNGAAK